METVDPDAVVISCGVENSYGHPRAAVMNQLRQMGVEVYRTDEQGTIVVYSDGENIIWNCSASESWKAGEPTVSDAGQETSQLQEELQKEPGQEVDNAAYVLNTNTGKFHKPSCSSVEQISEKNREYTNKSREEMIEAGYEPCKRCNP